MESKQYAGIVDIDKIFYLEEELLSCQKKEQKEAMSSLKRLDIERTDKEKDSTFGKVISALFRKTNNKPVTVKYGKEEIIEELLTQFKALKESGNEHLLMKYLNFLNEGRLKELYGIELNKYGLEPKIEILPMSFDPTIYPNFLINKVMIKVYELTEENLGGASKLVSDIIVALERLKENELNKLKGSELNKNRNN